MYILTFGLYTASLYQGIRLTGYKKPYKPLCSAVIGWFSTAVFGAFRSLLFHWVVLSVVHFFLLLDHGHPCFWNFNSTIPVDVVNRLFDPVCVPLRITINKVYLIPKWIVSGVGGVWSLILSFIGFPCYVHVMYMELCTLTRWLKMKHTWQSSLANVNFATLTGNYVNNTALFSRFGRVFWPY